MKRGIAMKEYIKAMRLPACVFAGFTTFISFKLTNDIKDSMLPIIATILISIATMVQNDLRDRWNDHKKGKDFAYDHPIQFRKFAIFLWIFSLIPTILMAFQNPWYLLVTLSMITIGLLYSELQRIPFLPNIFVAIAMGIAVCYPICNGANPWLLLYFSTFICLIMLSREILKDFDDKDIDDGHKWTLIQKYGEKNAKFISAFIIIFIDRFSEVITLPIFFLHKLIFRDTAIDLWIDEPTPELISNIKMRLDLGMLTVALMFALGQTS